MRRGLLSPFVASAALALTLVFVTGTARATVVVPLTLAQQVQRADLVVRATVGAQHSAYVPARGAILTWTTLRVTETLKGQAPSTLLLRQMGGVANGMEEMVPGDAHLSQGQDVLVFLHREGGTVFLLALAQSCYFVDQATGRVHRDLSELTFAALGQTGMRLSRAPSQTSQIDVLRAQIRALVGGAR